MRFDSVTTASEPDGITFDQSSSTVDVFAYDIETFETLN